MCLGLLLGGGGDGGGGGGGDILGCPYIRQCPAGLYYNQVCALVFSLVVVMVVVVVVVVVMVVVVVVVVVTSWAAPTSGSVRLDCTTTRCVPWSSP